MCECSAAYGGEIVSFVDVPKALVVDHELIGGPSGCVSYVHTTGERLDVFDASWRDGAAHITPRPLVVDPNQLDRDIRPIAHLNRRNNAENDKVKRFQGSFNIHALKQLIKICNKRFMRSDHLSKHVKTHSNNGEEASNGSETSDSEASRQASMSSPGSVRSHIGPISPGSDHVPGHTDLSSGHRL